MMRPSLGHAITKSVRHQGMHGMRAARLVIVGGMIGGTLYTVFIATVHGRTLGSTTALLLAFVLVVACVIFDYRGASLLLSGIIKGISAYRRARSPEA